MNSCALVEIDLVFSVYFDKPGSGSSTIVWLIKIYQLYNIQKIYYNLIYTVENYIYKLYLLDSFWEYSLQATSVENLATILSLMYFQLFFSNFCMKFLLNKTFNFRKHCIGIVCYLSNFLPSGSLLGVWYFDKLLPHSKSHWVQDGL